MSQEIKKGMIVTKKDGSIGHVRVTRVTKNTINVGAIYGNKIYEKGSPKDLWIEDSEGFYERWRKSETYRCM